MSEQLHFSELWPHWPELLAGLWVTIQLTVMATLGGLAIGIFGAAIRSGRATWFSRIWGGYVEIIRNTPFVVQLFFIVFGLPKVPSVKYKSSQSNKIEKCYLHYAVS